MRNHVVRRFTSIMLVAGFIACLTSETTIQAAEAGKKKIARIAVDPSYRSVNVGGSVHYTARAYDSRGRIVRRVRFTWSSTAPSVATVDSAGNASAVGLGTTSVRAQAQGKTGSAVLDVRNEVVGGSLYNLFFLHHSTGNGFVEEGDMRSYISDFNSGHGTAFEFWDHGYNGDGLRNPSGHNTGTSYDIPNDNTDPDGLWYLWTGTDTECVQARNRILSNHQVIAFKSCFPASAIYDGAMLDQYKSWYLQMRDVFDANPDKVFVVMSTPPLHRLSTDRTEARNARLFANWLKSAEYLSGHPNVIYFDVFDILAAPDDGSSTANMLRYQYELDHGDGDSHPNASANRAVGPVFAQALIDASAALD